MFALGIDIGTTNWKAGIFDDMGGLMALFRTPARLDDDTIDPDVLISTLAEGIRGLPGELLAKVRAIGVTGMAEGGLLTDRYGKVRCPILPWHNRIGMEQYLKRHTKEQEAERFLLTGLRNSWKYSIYRVLSYRGDLHGLRWLGVPEYIAFRLCGRMATEPSLAARTYAYDIIRGRWDEKYLQSLGIPDDLFAEVCPSGSPLGTLRAKEAALLMVPEGATVSICGHDHLCAALASACPIDEDMFLSSGTSQVLLGLQTPPDLGEKAFGQGFSFGPALRNEGSLVFMGGLQAAGGSLKWLLDTCFNGKSLQDLEKMIEKPQDEPTGILYFPYLNGSGAPIHDAGAKAAFIGLSADTGSAALAFAVFEGLAYETRMMLDSAPSRAGSRIIAAGGMTRYSGYMQILADVLAVPVSVSAREEDTLCGAALLALDAKPRAEIGRTYTPRAGCSTAYGRLYREGYLPLQEPLRGFYDIPQ